MSSLPPLWLRGPVPDVPPALQGVAHGFLEALEEVQHALTSLPETALWFRPSGAASVGFHLRHMAGATDRLLTYARGETLTDTQRAALVAEQRSETDTITTADLLAVLESTIQDAVAQLRSTSVSTLDEPRFVGKKQLPSTVRGLIEHAAQHACRHAGQIVTTVKVVGTSI